MSNAPLSPDKFQDPVWTAKGDRRATVSLDRLDTLWFNTGTLCNLTCGHCYIESSPRNDRLAYLSLDEVVPFLDEIATLGLGTREIGLTGGEPFMNPDIVPILETILARGFRALVLTNAMRPMRRHDEAIARLAAAYPGQLALRVSLDHFTAEGHEAERGQRSWGPTIDGLRFLAGLDVALSVAGRLALGSDEAALRSGFEQLFHELGVGISARLVLFPEMDVTVDVPEITTACWGILHKAPSDVMCSSSRMVVRRKGADRPEVLACTLIAYDDAFSLGATLTDARREVALNHPHCAKFCVLGGASCSG